MSLRALSSLFHSLESSFFPNTKSKGDFGSIVAATTTLKNFALASFWSLPSNLHSNFPCFVKFTSFSFFLHKGSLSITDWCTSLTGLSPELGPATSWAASPRKLCISGGQLSFPLEIAQSCLAAYWAPRLCNSTSQHSQQELCNFPQQGWSSQNLCKFGQ